MPATSTTLRGLIQALGRRTRDQVKEFLKKIFDCRRLALEQHRPVSGIAKTRYASAVGCGFTQAKALSVPGLPGQKSIAFSGLTIRSSRDRCAASAKSRRIVTLPWPRSGPA